MLSFLATAPNETYLKNLPVRDATITDVFPVVCKAWAGYVNPMNSGGVFWREAIDRRMLDTVLSPDFSANYQQISRMHSLLPGAPQPNPRALYAETEA